jgi:hypothetical protein
MFVGLGGKVELVRSMKCGDATKSKLTEGVSSRWCRSMLVSESKSFPASDVFWADGEAPKYMLVMI